jgi:hypothetical protein
MIGPPEAVTLKIYIRYFQRVDMTVIRMDTKFPERMLLA